MAGLPLEQTSFIGRESELAEIRRLLAATNLITLTGPGGVGKSRLALHAAHSVARKFPDGAWIFELAELDSADLVPYALARSLGVRERMDEGITETLFAHLHERRTLIVLDNCEHLLDSCRSLVTAIISTCPRVRILCTSRERLDIQGEVILPVPGLAVPSEGDSNDGLAACPALRLLTERTVAIAPDFDLAAEDIDVLSEICRRLDGLPLAIELAAVRLASMSPEVLKERLDDRLSLLSRTQIGRPERGQTLWAAIDWSHELLSDDERVLWRRLSVFTGSFGLQAVEEICSEPGLERGRVADLISGLVAKSIITMGHGKRRGRYRLLETLRLYGTQRLAEAGETSMLAATHAAWFADRFSGGHPPWWGGSKQAATIDLLDVEWANVEAALDYLSITEDGAEVGLQLAADLFGYCMVRGQYRAGRRRIDAFLAAGPSLTEGHAMAAWASGFLAQATSDFEPALAACEEARRIAEQVQAPRALAYSLLGLGLVRMRMGEFELAGQLLVDADNTMLRVEDPFGIATVLYFRALAAASAGQLSEARRMALDGMQASGRVGETWIAGVLTSVLGAVEAQLGDLPEGDSHLKESVRLHSTIGHRWGMAMTFEGLAFVAGCSDRLERASLLLGAHATIIASEGIILVPYVQQQHDVCEAAIRAGLDGESSRASREHGKALSFADAVAIALEHPPLANERDPTPLPSRRTAELTARELEMAQLVAAGLSNKAIAAALFVSAATVKTHVSHILEKLALDSRVQIATWLSTHPEADGKQQLT